MIFIILKTRECDFIVKERKKGMSTLQVCSLITPENRGREFEGLKEAMGKLNIKHGTILTLVSHKNNETDIAI